MAYYINGKAFTDHPLMDEIVYNCKLILNGIVVKNDVLANSYETESSINNAEMLFLQTETGRDISFDLFVFNEEILLAYGYSQAQVDYYLKNKNNIPVSDRSSLTAFANEYFRENFTEENNYYRMLNGLPPFDTGERYYIWLTSSDIPSDYTGEVDFSLPLHEQPRDLINVLYVEGVISNLREIYPGSDYSYMNYLGEKQIDVYTARKAGKWDIIYMPSVYYLIEDRFLDLYKINRETYINRSYQDFFAEMGEYYDQMMIVIVLAQTFADLITDTPQWYIRRDIFDIKSCRFFLESAGVKYFKEIPLKYQIRIVKNLNRLIQNKSSNQNLDDILDVFDVDGTNIYKYWLYKKPTKDGKYDLEFISSNYKESYDNYIKDATHRTDYDSITFQDKYWDGELDHQTVKDRILEQDFTIQGTKYMSVEYRINMTEYIYQMEYMLGMILDSSNQESLSEIKFAIPSINETAQFRFSDVFLFLVILTNEYYQFSSDVKYPNRTDEGPEPPINEDYYDWLKKTFSKAFILKNGRVHGFNPDLDKDELLDYLRKGRHSHFIFGANQDVYNGTPSLTDPEYYELSENLISSLSIDEYIVPKDIYDIDTLVNVYKTNTKVYNKVKQAIIDAQDHNDKVILEYAFQELFTRAYDVDMYKYTDDEGEVHIYNNLIEILRDRDFILYETYLSVTTESNIDSKRDMLRGIMNDVLDTLEYYLSSDGLSYLYSFVAINSPSAIVSYLYDMFNFFKSYKVYFLDPYYTLLCDDKYDNSQKAIDRVNEYNWIQNKSDSSNTSDYITAINMSTVFKDMAEDTNMVDIYAHYDPDPLSDLDFNGIHAEDGESVTQEIDGGLADDASAYPYIEANGGSAYLGSPNISDINGAEADEYDREYYQIDGGHAYHVDDLDTDGMGRQMFNFEIDGGGAGKRNFVTNTMNLDFIGTEFIANVRISDRDDCIEIKDDGLFVDPEAITTNDNFSSLQLILNNVINNLLPDIKDIEEVLSILVNANLNIETNIDEVTGDMTYAVDMNTDNHFEKKLRFHVDDLVTILNSEFPDSRLNPFIWEDL